MITTTPKHQSLSQLMPEMESGEILGPGRKPEFKTALSLCWGTLESELFSFVIDKMEIIPYGLLWG